jgi:hypothetical protein
VSFFAKLGSFFKRLFTSAPTWEHTALSVIGYVSPIVESVLTIADPPLAVVLTPIIERVKASLTTLYTVTSDLQVTPGTTAIVTIQRELDAVKSDLSSILSLAEVKNSAKAASITAAVNLVVGELDNLLAQLPVSSAPAPPVPPVTQ